MMSPPRSRAASTRLTLAGAIAALVLGILGMHALSLHGPGTLVEAVPTTSTITSTSSDPGHAHPGSHSLTAPDPHDRYVEPGDGGVPGMGDMVVLCGVMLAAVAGTLLLLETSRRSPCPWALTRLAHAHPLVTRPRPPGTGQPPVWRFSVIRC